MPVVKFPLDLVKGLPVVVAPGEIDITNAAELRAALVQAAADGHKTLVVDMTGTRFCDSAGLHVLVHAHKRARAGGGDLLLAPSGGEVARILEITGVDRVVPTFASLEETLAHAADSAGGENRGPA